MTDIPAADEAIQTTEKPQNGSISPVAPLQEPDWDSLPELLTTNEAAAIIGKDSANVRARASKGEFGNVQKDDMQRSLYRRDAVRAVYEKIAKNRNPTALHGVSVRRVERNELTVSAVSTALIAEIKDGKNREIALLSAQYADKVQDVETLRLLLEQREETTREIISEIVTQCDTRVEEIEAHRAETVAAKDAEIERLRQELEAAQQSATKRRKFFGLFG